MNTSDKTGMLLKAPPETGLSDEAFTLLGGWFSFGPKATVNIGPPHKNLHANRAALDELVAQNIIRHSYEEWNDTHTFKGTEAAGDIAHMAMIQFASGGQDPAEGLGAEHDSPTREAGDAQ